MNWRPHTERPRGTEPALVAVASPRGGAPYLLAQLYRYDATEDRWYGVSNVLQLRHDAFHWLPAGDVLQTLPAPEQPAIQP